jgi:hypothetical protein
MTASSSGESRANHTSLSSLARGAGKPASCASPDRYAKLHAGASWIAEYGDPGNPETWQFLKEISTYHAAVPGRPYPPILIGDEAGATTASVGVRLPSRLTAIRR